MQDNILKLYYKHIDDFRNKLIKKYNESVNFSINIDEGLYGGSKITVLSQFGDKLEVKVSESGKETIKEYIVDDKSKEEREHEYESKFLEYGVINIRITAKERKVGDKVEYYLKDRLGKEYCAESLEELNKLIYSRYYKNNSLSEFKVAEVYEEDNFRLEDYLKEDKAKLINLNSYSEFGSYLLD